jgi:oxygen-independent coproporphyrinogen-3 oxidase
VSDPEISLDQLMRLDRPLPRYTSYPTAPEWGEISPNSYQNALIQFDQTAQPLSLYVHIPFCKTMCLYCGCSVVLNRRPENEVRYVDYLMREISLIADRFQHRHPVVQLHFGGGTPTKLSEEQLERLMTHLHRCLPLAPNAEIAIEIDPRTVVEDQGRKLRHLRALGFNRVSFGVQDTDPKVQEAVKRRQSYEMTRETYELARDLGFDGINIDLIYGLPYQTCASFADTAEKIAALRPDRIAFFSYAKVPWLKPHQKAIPDAALPTTAEKFQIYLSARRTFLSHGYLGIGMDHFALREDELARAYRSGTLHRNFQGYTVKRAEEMLGLGITAVGSCSHGYFQNAKELSEYYASLDQGILPVRRGMFLQPEDLLRRWVIQSLMCHFTLDKNAFSARFGTDFGLHFADQRETLAALQAEGLILDTPECLSATPLGQLFIRHVAAPFDAYLSAQRLRRFSQAV